MKYWRIAVWFLPAGLSFFLTPCFAWGRSGHHIIAEIARSVMRRGTIENVQKYLGAMSYDEASIWMDEMRSDASYDYMKPWHYINVEKGGQYVAGNGDNIVDKLNLTCRELRNKQQLS